MPFWMIVFHKASFPGIPSALKLFLLLLTDIDIYLHSVCQCYKTDMCLAGEHKSKLKIKYKGVELINEGSVINTATPRGIFIIGSSVMNLLCVTCHERQQPHPHNLLLLTSSLYRLRWFVKCPKRFFLNSKNYPYIYTFQSIQTQ